MRPSIFDFLGILKPESLNWREGGRRVKIVLQVLGGVSVFLFVLSDSATSYGRFYGFFLALFAAIGVFLGIEIVFRVSVWIFKGFASTK